MVSFYCQNNLKQNPNIFYFIILVWSAYSPNLDRSVMVHAGNDSDGSPMYVGRATHSCDLIPGKLLASHRCHVSYNGEEFSKEASEVLINNGYTWVHSSDGNVPQGAVVGGRTSSGEVLYVGRASHCGILTPGKVHPSHRCLYLPFGWKEHRYTAYEVLVRQQNWNCPPVHPPHCPPPHHPIHPCPPPVQPPPCHCQPGCRGGGCNNHHCRGGNRHGNHGRGHGHGKRC